MSQLGGLEEILLFLNSKLKGEVEWAVDGSVALKLQGIKIEPHDIDVLTDHDGAIKMASIFNEYIQKPLSYGETERYRSHFCILKIKEVNVEIMGDLQVFRKGRWSEVQNPDSTGVKYVDLKGNKIPVVPLDYLESTGYAKERLEREGRNDKFMLKY